MIRLDCFLALLVVVFSSMVQPCAAEMVTITDLDDSYITGSLISGTNSDNFGGSGILSAYRNAHLWGDTLVRANQIFGTGSSQIPNDAEIESASLHIWLDVSWSGGTNTYTLFQLDQDWSEMTVTSANYGRVADHSIGGPVDSVAGPTSNTYTNTEYVFDVTDSVSNWQSGQNNYGWGLTATSARNEFFSSESTSASFRPFLVVNFGAVPEPSSLMAFGLASVVVMLRRSRTKSNVAQTSDS